MLTSKFLFMTVLVFTAFHAKADDAQVVNPDATYAVISTKIFKQDCVLCHTNVSATDTPAAGVELDTFATITSSNVGAQFIIPGDPEHSALYLAVKSGEMPEADAGAPVPLTSAEVQDIFDWIKAGALNN